MVTEVAPLAASHGSGPGASATIAGRVTLLTLFVNGKPQPKGRPRSAVGKDGRVHVFTDDNTLTWEQNVGWQVKQQLIALGMSQSLPLPFQGRVVAHLRFNFDKPKSAAKTVLFPVKSRTDVDNLAKAILDALQNVGVLVNDNIVTDLTCTKRFSEVGHPQGVEIELTAWTE